MGQRLGEVAEVLGRHRVESPLRRAQVGGRDRRAPRTLRWLRRRGRSAQAPVRARTSTGGTRLRHPRCRLYRARTDEGAGRPPRAAHGSRRSCPQRAATRRVRTRAPGAATPQHRARWTRTRRCTRRVVRRSPRSGSASPARLVLAPICVDVERTNRASRAMRTARSSASQRHQLAVDVVCGRLAPLPDAGVGLPPHRRDVIGEPADRAPRLAVQSVAALGDSPCRVHDPAVAVELMLVRRTVADAHRARVPVARPRAQLTLSTESPAVEGRAPREGDGVTSGWRATARRGTRAPHAHDRNP